MTRKNNMNHSAIKAGTMTAILTASMLAFAGCANQDAYASLPAYEAPVLASEYSLIVPESEPRPLDKPIAEAIDETMEVSSAKASSGISVEMRNVNNIAKLADLVGNWTLYEMYEYSVVDIDSDTNPYDLDWRYGPAPDAKLSIAKTVKLVKSDEWCDLWESYVDACDWSLVFDADFYMETFPMLAELYDHDKDALLRHYQTVGVHEGRQANETFCPAAYMENCNRYLKKNFENNPECYIIYYMLHYDAQSKIDAANKDGKYPVWLSVEMSYTQAKELEKANEYREAAESDPILPHPELMALANLRCRIDAIGQYAAHDWLYTKDCKSLKYPNVIGVKYWDENTIKKDTPTSDIIRTPYKNYYNSKPHYEAMIDPNQEYAGFSNFYFSSEWKKVVHFQIYTPSCPNPGTNEVSK